MVNTRFSEINDVTYKSITTFRIVEAEEDILPIRYEFTEKELYLMAQLLCGDKNVDGDGEYDIDFKKNINHVEVNKVLGVVMNRVRSPEFPNTVTDVILQPRQFCVMPQNLKTRPSTIALMTVREWTNAYNRYENSIKTTPENHLYFSGNGLINTTRAQYR